MTPLVQDKVLIRGKFKEAHRMIKKVEVSRLTIGMYVHKLDRPYLETPFLTHHFLIKNPKQIDQLQAYCRYVLIDTEKGADLKPDSAETPPPSQETPKKESKKTSIPGENALRRALRVRNQAKKVIETILEDVRLGQTIETDGAKKSVNTIIESLMEDKDALICLSNLRHRDEYTAIHSINVCVLSVALGRQVGLGREELELIGLGGLLHDLGKMKVPLEILNKPDKLTESEFEIMKKHVLFGADLLKKIEDLPQRAIDFVLQHHERYNGRGYPLGLTGDGIDIFGRIAAIVDVYDAITSDRVYRKSMSPYEGIRKIYEWSANDFDKSLVELFIKSVGIYPVGSLVEVNHSDIGLVVSNNIDALKPCVLLLLDRHKQKYQPPRLIDLMEKIPDFHKYLWSISRILWPAKEEYLSGFLGIVEQEGCGEVLLDGN
jgi:putative nucleotidyltransferase with HDIG domain